MRSRLESATCESNIRLTRFQMAMRIRVKHEGSEDVVESSEPISINDILGRLGIPPSTVLAVHEEKIVPHTSIINGDLELELVIVSSGG